MTLFILFLFIFSIFFTFDNKPINLLLDFIGIILSISFFLILYSNSTIDLSFFSFIFIIIYGSALAILFAFIIMLFSNSNTVNNNLPNYLVNSFLPIKFLFNSFTYQDNQKLTYFNNINFYNSFFFSFIKLYLIPILLFISFSSFFYLFFTMNYLSSFINTVNYDNKSLFLSFFFSSLASNVTNVSLANYIFNSFLFNPFPLILIINILLLGLIGAVFLLIV